MEACWIRRSDLILPGCGENLLLIRRWDLIHLVSGANSTLGNSPACWIHEPQPISNQQSVIAVRGFTSCGVVSTPGLYVVRPRVVTAVESWNEF